MEYQTTIPPIINAGANDGFGAGGGILGGLVLGSLLGRGGLGGWGNNGWGGFNGGCGFGGFGGFGVNGVEGLNNLQGAIDTNAILSNLGDIKGAIPLAESQTQLAIAQAQSDITQQNQAQTLALQQQGFNGQLANLAGFANTKDAVDSLSTQVAVGQGVTNTNIERLGWQLSREIGCDGDKTRALINNIEQANLNRIITNQAAELAELRNEHARSNDRHGIEITMTNNQAQAQLQAQAQQQQIANLTACMHGISQLAQATNQQLIIGNTGVASGGNQTSNPVNVRA